MLCLVVLTGPEFVIVATDISLPLHNVGTGFIVGFFRKRVIFMKNEIRLVTVEARFW